jgi:hypothetical protein
MNKAGVERVEGTIQVTLNADGSFSNVRVLNVSPNSVRNGVQRIFNAALTDASCRAKGEGEKSELEIPFVMKLE